MCMSRFELLDVKVVVQMFYPRLRYYVYACAKKNAILCSTSSSFSCSLDILLLFLWCAKTSIAKISISWYVLCVFGRQKEIFSRLYRWNQTFTVEMFSSRLRLVLPHEQPFHLQILTTTLLLLGLVDLHLVTPLDSLTGQPLSLNPCRSPWCSSHHLADVECWCFYQARTGLGVIGRL
jgi:hypothetical protein